MSSWFSSDALGRRGRAQAPRARIVSARDRDRVLGHLLHDRVGNLFLIDLVAQIGGSFSPLESPPQILAVWREGECLGVASLRPSLAFDAAMTDDALAACLPFIETVESGLVKSRHDLVGVAWDRLSACRRQAMVDRAETAYQVRPQEAHTVEPPHGAVARSATVDDLEALVVAARASLREEGRPDPFDGDPTGFRRWVRSRLHRARVVDLDGHIVFVGYADVRRSEGWLIQGVYTWPEARRRGFASAGMSALLREAATEGADHVQLAVIETNQPAIGLYESLGFEPAGRLRTLLFV